MVKTVLALVGVGVGLPLIGGLLAIIPGVNIIVGALIVLGGAFGVFFVVNAIGTANGWWK